MFDTYHVRSVAARSTRGGHMPDHLREAFLDALEAYYKQGGRGHSGEVLKNACGPLWNCTDVLPGTDCDLVSEIAGTDRRGYSYGAAARQIRRYLEE